MHFHRVLTTSGTLSGRKRPGPTQISGGPGSRRTSLVAVDHVDQVALQRYLAANGTSSHGRGLHRRAHPANPASMAKALAKAPGDLALSWAPQRPSDRTSMDEDTTPSGLLPKPLPEPECRP